MAFEVDRLRPVGKNSETGQKIWHLSSAFDNLQQMLSAGYIVNTLSSLNLTDMILLQAADGNELVSVGSINGSDEVTLNKPRSPILDVRLVLSDTNITAPAGTRSIFYILSGAGGGAGGRFVDGAESAGGGGGEGGALVVAVRNDPPLTSQAVIIGQAGVNGANGLTPTAGTDGGDTSYLGSEARGGDGGSPGSSGGGGARGDGEASFVVGAGSLGGGITGSNATDGLEFDGQPEHNAETSLSTGAGGESLFFGRGRGGGGYGGAGRLGAIDGCALIIFFS